MATKYDVGDVGMVLKTDNPATSSSRKLISKFKVSFRISRVMFNYRYEVEDLREGLENYKTVVAEDKN